MQDTVYLLVGIAGRNKGLSCSIDASGLVMGRGAGVDVLVDDPIVSRRHCLVQLKEGEIYLKDLGSRTPALVNGLPVLNGVLHNGDELALGQERFLLTENRLGTALLSKLSGDAPPTISWKKFTPLSLSPQEAQTTVKERPKTITDLLLLHEITQHISASTSIDEMAEILSVCLQERFHPTHLWFALVREGEERIFNPQRSPEFTWEAQPPRKLIRDAIDSRQGLLSAKRADESASGNPVYTMVSPLVMNDNCVAVIAMESTNPTESYNEEDLSFLILLSQAIAPLFFATEQWLQLQRDHERLREKAGVGSELVGDSDIMKQLRSQIRQVAATPLNVLITGETGTGKELVAQSLHAQSSYHTGPFVVVNCAAIPRELFESVFFGHEKGAFTGAHQRSMGLMAQAHGGTLFLDEVADLSLDSQARILRAIEQRTFRPVGGKSEISVDIRVIAATNKAIPEVLASGAFREDLYHRLSGFEIVVPPLRERASDIPQLVQHFFDIAKDHAKLPLEGIDPEALDYLASFSWKGNVRELQNTVLRAISMARTPILIADAFSSFLQQEEQKHEESLVSLEAMEKAYIARVFQHCEGNVKQAAALLEISRTTLYKKLHDYHIV